jgi:hypothetical protein
MRLVIKEFVKTIEDNEFEDYEVLKQLNLCDGLRQIGNYSLKGCVSLEKIEIHSKLESIGLSAFEGCSGATELIIPKGNLKSIGNGAFTGCVKINRVENPDKVENLGTVVFMKCTGLREVILPQYIKEISEGLFLQCTLSEKITLPQYAETIHQN